MQGPTFLLAEASPDCQHRKHRTTSWILLQTTVSWERRGFVITLLAVAFIINGIYFGVRQQQAAQRFIASHPATSIVQTPSAPQASVTSGPTGQQLEQERQTALAKKAADDTAIARFALEQRAAADAAAEQAAAQEKALQEAAARHSADLERYLSVRVERKQGVKTVAVAVASDDGKLNRTVADALARHFSSDGVEMLTSVFTKEFASDGLFAEMFNGSRSGLSRLDLADSLDTIILGQETITYSQDPSLENLISAHLHLDVMTMSVATKGDSRSWTFTANGAGFKRDDARQMAEERVIKQIIGDTNMSLTLNPATAH